MANLSKTVIDVKLKARRTSLGEKTNDELINIILRKDKTERSLNRKIQILMERIKKYSESTNILNDENSI